MNPESYLLLLLCGWLLLAVVTLRGMLRLVRRHQQDAAQEEDDVRPVAPRQRVPDVPSGYSGEHERTPHGASPGLAGVERRPV